MKKTIRRIALVAILLCGLGSTTVQADGTFPPPSCPPNTICE
jgi:hypothetical protein